MDNIRHMHNSWQASGLHYQISVKIIEIVEIVVLEPGLRGWFPEGGNGCPNPSIRKEKDSRYGLSPPIPKVREASAP